MQDIKRIVVGIDFSIYSSRVLEYAIGIAVSNAAELIAVSVINNRQIEYIKTVCREEAPTTITLNKFIDDETRRRTHNIENLIGQRASNKISARIIIRIGIPFEEILQVVDEEQADLVVISSKGRTNLKDFMFGTTSEKIFRHSPVSVLSLNLRE